MGLHKVRGGEPLEMALANARICSYGNHFLIRLAWAGPPPWRLAIAHLPIIKPKVAPSQMLGTLPGRATGERLKAPDVYLLTPAKTTPFYIRN